MKTDQALLVLEDGTVFEGRPFGKTGRVVGETVFTTGVVGYQEVVTDPSYAGTLAVLTYPIVGSYGVNDADNASPQAHARGVVIREYSRTQSNFRSTGSFEDFLLARGVVGIREVDTRAVAVHLRDHGEMKGIIVSDGTDRKQALAELKKTPSPWESDLLADLEAPAVPKPRDGAMHKLTALNVGINAGCLASLAALGCAVTVLPASATPQEVLAAKGKGLIVAGGPGDPHVPAYVVETIRALLGKVPMLGVGLGHELLALALGCKIKRMTTGCHGVNYSVKRFSDGKGEVTMQQHSFTVDDTAIPADVEVTHVNVNDRTIAGIRSTAHPAQSVQYHPGCDDRAKPNMLYRDFVERLAL